MPNFTKESVHHAFCNLPEEQKMNLAISCAQYGVTPESIENLCTGILKCVEPVINRAIENLKYWSDNDDKC